MEIVYVNYGIASRHEDHIEVNRALKRYPELFNDVIEHEKGHTEKTMDFMHDLLDGFNIKKQWELLKFCIRHPKSFVEMLPAYKDCNGRWAVNYFLVISYSVTIALLITDIYLWRFALRWQ